MPDASLSRRPSPILLIIPVLLTVGGVGGSVALYLHHNDKDKGTRIKEEKAAEKLAGLIAERDQARADLGRLRAVLGYPGEDYQRWLTEKLQGKADFKDAMTGRQTVLQGHQATVDSLQAELKTIAGQIATEQKAKTDLKEAKKAELTQKRKDFDALDKTYAPRIKDLRKRIAESSDSLMTKSDDRQRVERGRIDAKTTQDETLVSIQREVERLEDALGKRRGLIQDVDGRVVTVLHGTDRIVIDLGRRHRLRPGMLFRVVEKGQTTPNLKDPEGPHQIPKNAMEKGDIEILRVFEDQSQAVVLNVDFSRPILPGDPIFNVGYDPRYQTRFVVVGQIDLNGNGQHDQELTERLIADVGGVIEDDNTVNVRTDFLLEGTNWPTDDPELRKRYYRDQEQIEAAESLKVSFLSVRRFLKYVGVRVGSDNVVRPVEADF